jgi:hypothetical protein
MSLLDQAANAVTIMAEITMKISARTKIAPSSGRSRAAKRPVADSAVKKPLNIFGSSRESFVIMGLS